MLQAANPNLSYLITASLLNLLIPRPDDRRKGNKAVFAKKKNDLLDEEDSKSVPSVVSRNHDRTGRLLKSVITWKTTTHEMKDREIHDENKRKKSLMTPRKSTKAILLKE